MFRRIAALGTPPLLLVLVVLLLIRYQPLILEALWGGRLPQVWRHVLHHLPLVLAAAGMAAGLRMPSCGILIVMGALVVLCLVRMPADPLSAAFAPEADAVLPALRILLPPCYLLAYGTLGHSWRSRRGLAALALVAATLGGLLHAAVGAAPLPFLRMPGLPPLGELPIFEGMRLQGWHGLLPALLAAGTLAVGALRAHDPLAAGLSTSLLLVLPALMGKLDPIALAVTTSAAVLSVLVGLVESMWALAYRDGLTGLPGRRGLDRALRQLGGRYAVAMLDVDHFKRFNDRFGHRTGDDVLKMIAARLRRIPGVGRFATAGRSSRSSLAGGRPARRRSAWSTSGRPWPERLLCCGTCRAAIEKPAAARRAGPCHAPRGPSR